MNEILLFSGGIDSYIGWHFLNMPPTIYFDLKTPYSAKEVYYIKKLIPDTKIDVSLDLSRHQQGEKAYIPFRNMYLAMLASHYADTVYIIGLKDDAVSDKNEQIFIKMSAILSEMEGRAISVFSPFWNMTKADIVSWFLNDYKGNAEQLLATVSCYSELETNYCGTCPCCFRKWVALMSNGIKLPFGNDALLIEYYKAAKKDQYDPKRNKNIIEVIDAYRS